MNQASMDGKPHDIYKIYTYRKAGVVYRREVHLLIDMARRGDRLPPNPLCRPSVSSGSRKEHHMFVFVLAFAVCQVDIVRWAPSIHRVRNNSRCRVSMLPRSRNVDQVFVFLKNGTR